MDERIPMNRTPMDSAVYETIRTASNVAHRCALCNEVLSTSAAPGPFLMDQLINAHHAVCPKRPIAIGDYVRWEFPRRDRFAEGAVTAIDGHKFTIKIESCTSEPWGLGCPDPAPGGEHTFHVVTDHYNCEATTIHRIPRPAAAQATISTSFGEIKITADPTLKPGEFGVEERKYHPVVVDKAMMERAMKDEKLMQRLQEEAGKRIQYLVTGGTKTYTLADPVAGQKRTIRVTHSDTPVGTLGPAPALIDGLTRERCLVQWLQNRLAVEGGAVPPNAMTRMQRDVGHAMWLAGPGTKWSAELRDRVAADREAERNRVTYCEVDPCD